MVPEFIKLTGCLINLEEKLTKNGAAYVDGKLSTKQTLIPIRFWNTSLDRLAAFISIENREKSSYVIEITGKYESYQGFDVFTVGEAGDLLIEELKMEDPIPYTFRSPISTKSIAKTVKKIVSEFHNQEYKEIVSQIVKKMEKNWEDIPLRESHQEIGGLLHHMWLLISRIKKFVPPQLPGEVETPFIDVELMISLAVIENFHLCCPFWDIETDKVLLGAAVAPLLTMFSIRQKVSNEWSFILHGLLAMQGIVPPAMQEIALLINFSKEEMETYRLSMQRSAMSEGTIRNGLFNPPIPEQKTM